MQPMWDGVGEPGGSKNTFNVDDVGYANASDVNMSVGALNVSLFTTQAGYGAMALLTQTVTLTKRKLMHLMAIVVTN